MSRRFVIAVVAASLLVIGLALPAGATEVSATGQISAGQFVTLTCPEGEQFAGTGSADFWRKDPASAKASHFLGSAPFVASADGLSATAGPAPKGSRFFVATMNCEPIPPPATVTIGETRTFAPFEGAEYYCPDGYVLDQGSVVVPTVPPGMFWTVNSIGGLFVVNQNSSLTITGTVSATCNLV